MFLTYILQFKYNLKYLLFKNVNKNEAKKDYKTNLSKLCLFKLIIKAVILKKLQIIL